MSDDITFDKNFDLEPGRAEEVAPGVRRIVADNPRAVHLQGHAQLHRRQGQGRDRRSGPGRSEHHIKAVLDAVRGETVTHIFVTHTHRDHSPAVPAIKAATGATVYAEGPHRASRPLNAGEAPRMEAANDMDFRPDHALADGDVVSGNGFALEAVTTPGHTANHMAFALKGTDIMFSGDHVMGWSTTIVAPPDGAMTDYMDSLQQAGAPRRAGLPAGPRRRDPRGAALRRRADPAPQGARGLDPAPARQGRDRHRDDRARDLYRARSAADQRGRLLGAGAHGGPGGARRGRDRRPARRSTAFIGWRGLSGLRVGLLAPSSAGSAGLSGVASSTASSIASESETMRAALVPKSCRP